jgi:putative sterol carrier protein
VPANEGRRTAGIAPAGGKAPGLTGLSGKLRLQVGETTAGMLQIEPSGAIEITQDGEAATLLAVDTQETLEALLRGELNPIVAHLQDRLRVEGDAALALRVLFGLQAGSPWNS